MSKPHLNYPDYPITGELSRICDTLQQSHLVLSAPPGSGKTTLVPLALLQASWLKKQKILILEPRRPAARMAALRMAQLLNEPVGEQVGYQVRFERHIGKQTRVEVLTEGLLLRRLQDDPELNGVGVVIFDEFHERSLVGDLSLALCRDCANSLRDDLRLLLMSASMDDQALATALGAAVIQAQGRVHPVDIEHVAPRPQTPPSLHWQRLIKQALQMQNNDVLAFLPGKGEIVQLQEALAGQDEVQVVALHGELNAQQQDKIIRAEASGKQRVILSTDIAETSLTIPGVGAVVDSGLNRKPRFDPNTGLTRLHTQPISQASALQRAGRAGRLGPGVCLRAWPAHEQARRSPDIKPEILSADLASLVLECAAWGVRSPQDLAWITTPPQAHWQQSSDLLQALDAINPQGAITAAGRCLLKLPTHPRLAHMLCNASNPNERELAAQLAALISERDPLPPDAGCDIDLRVQWLRASHGNQALRKRLLRITEQLQRQLPKLREPSPTAISSGALLARAYPERLAQNTGSGRFRLRNGRAVRLAANDPLTSAPWLVVASLDAGNKEGRVWLAAPIDAEQIESAFADHMERVHTLTWDTRSEAIRAHQVRRLDQLVLEERIVPIPSDADLSPLLIEQVKQRGLDLFENAQALRTLQGQIQLLRQHLPETSWPNVDDAALIAHAKTWLTPALQGIHKLAQLRKIDAATRLRQSLDWQQQQALTDWLPSHFETPAGTRRAIHYPEAGEPYLAVPLQEMLGQTHSPHIAQGRIPLLLHLLSPAGRPLQITRDLNAFWQGSYTEVRKEMRGRYPKHHWPDDPLNAAPTRLGRRGKPS